MDTIGERTATRIRRALGSDAVVREVKMFGALCFMVKEKLAMGAMSEGDLLVRIDPAQSEDLLARDGAEQAEMGQGRSMGTSWIRVAAASVQTEESLKFWVDAALRYNEALASKA